jgi:general stress protein CsbA
MRKPKITLKLLIAVLILFSISISKSYSQNDLAVNAKLVSKSAGKTYFQSAEKNEKTNSLIF